MPQLFSADWMGEFKDGWNANPDIKDKLAAIGFNSVIAYGFKGEDKARGVLVVKNGECVSAGAYNGESLDWDIRADRKNWLKWGKKGISMMGLGAAYTWRKLKFPTGNYGSMMKNPKMAGPFVKSFGLMKNISTT